MISKAETLGNVDFMGQFNAFVVQMQINFHMFEMFENVSQY